MRDSQTYSTVIERTSIKCTSAELADYRSQFVSDANVSVRISDMLTFEVFVYKKAFGVDPFDVFGRIKDLEIGTISGVKPASQFKHLPLKGLWHQHFFSAQFIMNNIRLGLGSKGVQRIVDQVFSNGSPVVTQEMIKEVSRRVVHEPLDGRIEQNK